MLTFHSCADAVRFHLVLQQILLLADWTPQMLRLPPMKPEWGAGGALLHRGPRVKTGAFLGQPRQVSPHGTTGRADYWGELVNRAARMMAAAQGGQMLCTAEVAAAVRTRTWLCWHCARPRALRCTDSSSGVRRTRR
jgi:hypothetical protein